MIDCILQIHFTEEKGDILCFCVGQEEIEELEHRLLDKIKKFHENSKKLLVCKLYAALPSK